MKKFITKFTAVHRKMKNNNNLSSKIKSFSSINIDDLKIKNGLLNYLLISTVLIVVFSLVCTILVTFLITKDKVAKSFKDSTTQILNQNKNYIDLVDSNIESISMQAFTNSSLTDELMLKTDDPYTSSQNINAITKQLSSLTGTGSSEFIKNIYLFNNNGFSCASDSSNVQDTDTLKRVSSSSWYKNAEKLDGVSFWTAPINDSVSKTKIISKVRALKNQGSGEQLGVLAINLDYSFFYNSLKNTKIGTNGYMMIVDSDKNIIAHKNQKLIGQKLKDSYWTNITKSSQGDFDSKIGGTNMYGVFATTKSGWKIIALTPKSELSSTATSIGIASLIVMFLFIIISAIISLFTATKFTKPIKDIIGITNKLSMGDFTVNSKKYSVYELNELSKNFNSMINQLRSMLIATTNLAADTNSTSEKLLDISNKLSDNSRDMVTTIEEISQGSSKQTEETVTCALVSDKFNNEITNTIEHIGSINSATNTTLNILSQSKQIISSLTDTSSANSKAMSEVSETISELNNNTKDILKILNKINKITKQTGLLSLNASIEAARAGEAGKGFSVVANEVRKLSEESKMASEEIKTIIDKVNNSIDISLEISASAQDAFKLELEKVNSTIVSFKEITESINNISLSMNDTKLSISVIDKDKKYINDSINNIAVISQENTASTQEVTAEIQEQYQVNNTMLETSKNLNSKSEELKRIVSNFKI